MQEDTSQVDGREGLPKLLFGRICCVMGLLLSTGGFVVATLGASVNLSAGDQAGAGGRHEEDRGSAQDDTRRP